MSNEKTNEFSSRTNEEDSLQSLRIISMTLLIISYCLGALALLLWVVGALSLLGDRSFGVGIVFGTIGILPLFSMWGLSRLLRNRSSVTTRRMIISVIGISISIVVIPVVLFVEGSF